MVLKSFGFFSFWDLFWGRNLLFVSTVLNGSSSPVEQTIIMLYTHDVLATVMLATKSNQFPSGELLFFFYNKNCLGPYFLNLPCKTFLSRWIYRKSLHYPKVSWTKWVHDSRFLVICNTSLFYTVIMLHVHGGRKWPWLSLWRSWAFCRELILVTVH